MDGPRNYHAKWSQSMRHQHQMLSLTCGIWKKDRTNFLAEQILTHRLWKTCGFQMKHVGGWGGALGFWDGNDIKFVYDDFLYNYKCNWAIKCYKLKNTILPVKKKRM